MNSAMLSISSGYLHNLTGISSNNSQDVLNSHTIDSFLESVEKKAYVMAYTACKDQQTALDIVQDAMYKMVKSYSGKPSEQWPPLFFKVLQNRITDQH